MHSKTAVTATAADYAAAVNGLNLQGRGGSGGGGSSCGRYDQGRKIATRDVTSSTRSLIGLKGCNFVGTLRSDWLRDSSTDLQVGTRSERFRTHFRIFAVKILRV